MSKIRITYLSKNNNLTLEERENESSIKARLVNTVLGVAKFFLIDSHTIIVN